VIAGRQAAWCSGSYCGCRKPVPPVQTRPLDAGTSVPWLAGSGLAGRAARRDARIARAAEAKASADAHLSNPAHSPEETAMPEDIQNWAADTGGSSRADGRR